HDATSTQISGDLHRNTTPPCDEFAGGQLQRNAPACFSGPRRPKCQSPPLSWDSRASNRVIATGGFAEPTVRVASRPTRQANWAQPIEEVLLGRFVVRLFGPFACCRSLATENVRDGRSQTLRVLFSSQQSHWVGMCPPSAIWMSG